MQTLGYIVLANLLSTLLSVGLAAALSFRWLSGLVDKMVCISAGLLLGVAFGHLLPDAFGSGASGEGLGWTLLAGVIGLFLLEKASLIHHTHHHEGDAHHHHHGHDADEAGRGGMAILVGGAFHNFADGVVIAAAFLADAQLGVAATLAVLAHEIPHEVGDFMILLNAGFGKARAFAYNLLSGASAVAGGVAGYFLLDTMQGALPYALALAAASFIYIALSDLLPEMMRRTSLRRTLPEVGLVLLGVALALAMTELLHGH